MVESPIDSVEGKGGNGSMAWVNKMPTWLTECRRKSYFCLHAQKMNVGEGGSKLVFFVDLVDWVSGQSSFFEVLVCSCKQLVAHLEILSAPNVFCHEVNLSNHGSRLYVAGKVVWILGCRTTCCILVENPVTGTYIGGGVICMACFCWARIE